MWGGRMRKCQAVGRGRLGETSELINVCAMKRRLLSLGALGEGEQVGAV